MRRRYKNPPIAEAVFEARFEPGDGWAIGAPSVLFERLSDNYPAEPRTLPASNVEIQANDTEGIAQVRISPRDGLVEFANRDRLRMARVSRTSLTVHVLAPYTSWEDFRTDITNSLEAYMAVSKAKSVNRIGIRYVNKIDLGDQPVLLSEYFNISIDVPVDQGFALGSFFSRMEAHLRDRPIKLIRNFASVPGETFAIALDIDVIQEDINARLFDANLIDTIDQLRQVERDVFEASITEKLRSTFGEYPKQP